MLVWLLEKWKILEPECLEDCINIQKKVVVTNKKYVTSCALVIALH